MYHNASLSSCILRFFIMRVMVIIIRVVVIIMRVMVIIIRVVVIIIRVMVIIIRVVVILIRVAVIIMCVVVNQHGFWPVSKKIHGDLFLDPYAIRICWITELSILMRSVHAVNFARYLRDRDQLDCAILTSL